MIITLGENMITRQMTLLFCHLLFELDPLVYFNFAFQNFQNSVPWVTPLHYVLVLKYKFKCKR